MGYTKRPDGRKMDELRPLIAKVGVVPNADGSAIFGFGGSKGQKGTVAIASVYGPKTITPCSLKKILKRGIIRVNYNMLPFSVTERARPGPSRRSKEIGLVSGNALAAVVDLKRFPGTVIDVEIMILQANASTRCAGINAAAMALAHAGIPMKDMVSSVAVGKLDKTLVVDLSKEEEDFEEGEGATDIPISVTHSGMITHFQLDGIIESKQLTEALELAKKSCDQIYEVQKEALKKYNKYGGKRIKWVEKE